RRLLLDTGDLADEQRRRDSRGECELELHHRLHPEILPMNRLSCAKMFIDQHLLDGSMENEVTALRRPFVGWRRVDRERLQSRVGKTAQQCGGDRVAEFAHV